MVKSGEKVKRTFLKNGWKIYTDLDVRKKIDGAETESTHRPTLIADNRSLLLNEPLAWLYESHSALNILKPFPNKSYCLRVCITRLLKTLWEKEKLLITSNFSFSHNVFYPFEEFSSIFTKYQSSSPSSFSEEEF